MPLAWFTVVRLLTVCSVLVMLAAGAAWAHPAQSEAMPGEAVFVVSGRGWGHGVGMSQYGAYGMANAGHSHEEILAHYYSGTEIGQAETKPVRVLLGEGKSAVTVSSAKPFTAVDGRGETFKLAPGAIVLRPKLKLPVVDAPRPVNVASPLVIRPGKATPLSLDGVQYRGSLELAVQGQFLRVVNFVRLDAYLPGVIANEMPHTWPSEALEAQAVAARSYALANLVKGKPFDLYSDVRSQVYRGVAGEKPRATAAVRATAGQVVLYGGRLATTYYFSTSGGRTASAADVFGTPVPYLLSRPDPWDKASPHHMWGPFLIGARTLQAKLGVADRILDAVGVPTPSGRLRSITLQTEGGSSSASAALFRTSLGLRSTWVTIGVLRLDQPRETVVFGSPLRLTGLARSLPEPLLSSSPDGSRWTEVGAVQRATSGIASLVVKPERTLRYRIEVEGAASPAILVEVAPRVQLTRGAGALSLSGTVRPRLSGATVFIERREGATWRRVAKKTVDAAGAFRAEVARQGEYRASIPATGDYAEAVTAALSIVGRAA